jgi:polysaccharide deacetylase 2 family uncharacterized protein YibQ
MLRLKPIRRKKRRGPSRDVLRLAHGAFWLSLLFAVLIGADAVATGFPKLLGLFIRSPQAEASAPSAHGVRVDLAAEPPAPPLRLRGKPVAAPIIAIVIDDLGGDVVHTSRAIALPREIALAFLPYPPDAPMLARAAGRRGHEVLVHVPMQAMGAADPGPMALSADLPRAEILRRLDWDFARVPGFVGINNHEGSKFTADRAALAPVMERLAGRGGFFFDSRTTADTQVMPAARAYGVETAARDVFLDDVPTVDAVDAQLRALEARARQQGAAIAIGHPHEITLDAVAYWAAHHDGFELVTLREAIRRKTELSLTLAAR